MPEIPKEKDHTCTQYSCCGGTSRSALRLRLAAGTAPTTPLLPPTQGRVGWRAQVQHALPHAPSLSDSIASPVLSRCTSCCSIHGLKTGPVARAGRIFATLRAAVDVHCRAWGARGAAWAGKGCRGSEGGAGHEVRQPGPGGAARPGHQMMGYGTGAAGSGFVDST